MRKYKILSSLIIGTFLVFSPFLAFGQSLTTEQLIKQLQDQINELLKQIENLRQQPLQPVSEIVKSPLNLGDIVVTTSNLRVRSVPSISGTSLAVIPLGTKGLITNGPISANGYNWWRVDWPISNDGWSVENWLEKATVTTPVPVPTPLPGVFSPQYEALPFNLILGQTYLFSASVKNGPKYSPILFYLQRPDGTMKYNGVPIPSQGDSTDQNGSWSYNTQRTLTVEGQHGTYVSWVTVDGVASNKAYHSVAGASGPALSQQSITILSPNGGEKWIIGSSSNQNILWTSNGLANTVDIWLTRDECYGCGNVTVVSGTPNTGSYTWNVPLSIIQSSGYRVHVWSKNNLGAYVDDISDAPFSIVSAEQSVSRPKMFVSLDASTPVSRSIVAGQTNVTFTTVRFSCTSSSRDCEFGSVSVSSDVPAAQSALSNIRLYDGSKLLGSASSLLHDNNFYPGQRWVTINFQSFTIPRNSAKTLTITADINAGATAGTVLRLGVAGLGSGFGSATNFPEVSFASDPFYGDPMTIIKALVPTLTLLGDVNNDGAVTISDSLKIQLHADGTTLLSGQALINADVTGEGKVNGIDAILVANYVGGFIARFPKEDGSVLVLGDANRDGKVNIGDSVVIANHVNGSSKITGRALDNADVDGDGKITNDDATLVANCVGGTIAGYPRGGSCAAGQVKSQIEITLDPSSPVSHYVFPGDQNVEFARIRLSASGESFSISQIVPKSGVSSMPLTEFYIYDNSTLLGSAVIRSTQEVPIIFLNPPLIIAKDSSRVLSLRANIGISSATYADARSLGIGSVIATGLSSALEIRFGEDVPMLGFVMNIGSISNLLAILGDANLDGTVTIGDSLKIQLHADGSSFLTGQAIANADVTGEGKVNGIDALIVAQYAGKLISKFPKEDGSSLFLGDANLDGKVNIGDSIPIQNYANGNTSALIGRALDNADVDNDGKITSTDANLVANCVGGKIAGYPRGGSCVVASPIPSVFIRVIAPNGGEKFNTDQFIPVSWQSSNIAGNVDIQLLLENNVVFTYSDTPNDGQENVSLQYVKQSGPKLGYVYKIRVKSPVGSSDDSIYDTGNPILYFDISDSSFAIVAGAQTDLELRSVTTGNWLYGFLLNICTNGTKSVNDLEREGVNIFGYPIHYIVYDAFGGEQVFDTSASGVLEDYKNGQCFETATTMQNQHRATYDQNGVVTFVLDYKNLITETNESNNSITFRKFASLSSSRFFASTIYAMMETLNSISKQLDLLK